MQNHVWGKTLLSVYRYLERIADAIDNIIEKKAVQTSSMLGSDALSHNTLALANKIIDLSERKVKLINIKLLTEQALSAMDPKGAKILIMKYFDNASCEEILSALSLSRRTYFRRIGEMEAAFEASCAMFGFPMERLDSYLANEAWIMNVKSSFQKGVESPLQLSRSERMCL